MATMALLVRFLHVTLAALWVGNLANLALVLLPTVRRQPGLDLGALANRLRWTLYLGPATFLAGAWLVTASGHTWSELGTPPWGHAIAGGIALAVAMMGIEGGVVVRKVRAAAGTGAGRDAALATAQKGAALAALLGVVAVLLMVGALMGGFV